MAVDVKEKFDKTINNNSDQHTNSIDIKLTGRIRQIRTDK